MNHLTLETLVALRELGAEPGDATAREHLQTCSACQAELERLHQRVARLKALPALRPSRDQWPHVATRLQAERRRRRSRMGAIAGLAIAASAAVALVLPGARGSSGIAAQEIEQAMARSQALESALSQYNPEGHILDGRTAGLAQGLEDRIARVDRELQMADLLERQTRDTQLLKLWRERVGLLDALVDVHVTHASNVGL
jgi:anti-sigma factor RsiW